MKTVKDSDGWKPEEPSKEKLLDSIKPGMELSRKFFLDIYGYEICFPGFASLAIKALKEAGLDQAERYYNIVVNEYLARQSIEMKKVASWYVRECEE